MILYLLKNEIYTGTYTRNRYNKSNGSKILNPESEFVRIPHHHTALVELTAFERVQQMLKERAPEMKTHPRAVASPRLLSGLVFCAHCGAKMISSTAKSGRFNYYCCQRKFKEGKASCSQRSFNADKLEPCIVDTIKDRVLTKEILSKLVSMVFEELEKEGSESETKRETLKNQKAETEKKRARYYELIESGAVEIADVAARLRELNTELETVSAEITKLAAKTPQGVAFQKPTEETVAAYVEDLRGTLDGGSIMHQKAFLSSFIRRINIKDSEAEIEFTCPIGLTGNRRNEVLSMAKIGSRGRTRTPRV